MENLEHKSNSELCVWKLTRLPVKSCMGCDGFHFQCSDYINYHQSKSVENITERYEQLIRRQLNDRRNS